MKNVTPQILLVEDDPYLALQIQCKLESIAKVTLAKSFALAANEIQLSQYPVAIIDLDLEEKLKGLDLIPLCLEFKIIPIIITHHQSPEVVARAHQLGAHYYFHKQDLLHKFEKELEPLLIHQLDLSFERKLREVFFTRSKQLISEVKSVPGFPQLILGDECNGKKFLAKCFFQMSAETPKIQVINFKKLNPDDAVQEINSLLSDYQCSQIHLVLGSIHLAPPKVRQLFQLILAKVPLVIATSEVPLDVLIDWSNEDRSLFAARIEITPLGKRTDDALYFLQRTFPHFQFSKTAIEKIKKFHYPQGNIHLINLIKVLEKKTIPVVETLDLTDEFLDQIYSDGNQGKWFYLPQVKRFIEQYGIKAYFDMIELEAFKDLYYKNGKHLAQTLHQLGVSRTVGSRLLQTMGIIHDKKNDAKQRSSAT